MFDQLKNIYNLRKQAEELQKQMAGELITATSGSVSLTLNGSLELIAVKVDPTMSLSAATLEKDIKSAYLTASDQMKARLAEKFKGLV